MANEKDITGGQGQNPSIDPKVLREAFRDIARDQQDISGAIRDILSDLNKTENAYKNIEARINRISKSTIDVKGVQREVNKLIDREFIINKANQELKNKAKQQSKDLLENAKKESIRLAESAKLAGKKFDINENILSTLQAFEDHEALELFYAEQALQLSKQRREEGEAQLELEKKLASSLGVSGKLLKKFADEFGMGSEVYEELSKAARKAEENGKSYSKLGVVFKVLGSAVKEALVDPLTYLYAAYKTTAAGLNLIKQGLNALTGTGGPVSQFVSPFNDLVKKIPLIGGLLGGILDIFANLVDFATGSNSEVQKFARNLGISYNEAKLITDQFDQLARTSGQAFITVEKLRKSQTELSDALGINNILSKEILAADAQIAEQAGLDLETRKQLAIVAGVTSATQTKIFATIAAQNKLLSNSLGVNLRVQDVIKKASSFAGVLGLTFAKYPEKLTKSLLITRALGMDLQKLDGLASGLLDFESSIAKEFEAQLLSGKNINMMRARELALNNDLAGLAVEINKQLGTSEDFLKSNRLIQESLADATGMTRDEIADMLKQQELFAKAGATDLKTFKERIVQMERAGTLQEDFISKLSEEQAQLFLNSTATERIASFFDKIRQSFANLLNNESFKGFIDTIITKLSDPNFINGIISKLTNFVSLLLQAVAAIVDAADVAAKVLSFGTVDISNRIPAQIRAIANEIGGVSLTGNVLRTQTAGTGTGQTTTTIAGGMGSPTINVIANTTVEDHAKSAHVRYSMAPKMDQKTGQMQQ